MPAQAGRSTETQQMREDHLVAVLHPRGTPTAVAPRPGSVCSTMTTIASIHPEHSKIGQSVVEHDEHLPGREGADQGVKRRLDGLSIVGYARRSGKPDSNSG